MWNPFAKPLPASVRSSAFPADYGYPNEHYLLPVEWDITADVPVGTNAHLVPGAIYNTDAIGYADMPGLEPDNAFQGRILSELGHTGSPRVLTASGPATGSTGSGVNSTGLNTPLVAPHPGYAGPVVGGADYAQSVANAYYAAQANAFSRQAAAESMVTAL